MALLCIRGLPDIYWGAVFVCDDGGLGTGSTELWLPHGVHLIVFRSVGGVVGCWNDTWSPMFELFLIRLCETGGGTGGSEFDSAS